MLPRTGRQDGSLLEIDRRNLPEPNRSESTAQAYRESSDSQSSFGLFISSQIEGPGRLHLLPPRDGRVLLMPQQPYRARMLDDDIIFVLGSFDRLIDAKQIDSRAR